MWWHWDRFRACGWAWAQAGAQVRFSQAGCAYFEQLFLQIVGWEGGIVMLSLFALGINEWSLPFNTYFDQGSS